MVYALSDPHDSSAQKEMSARPWGALLRMWRPYFCVRWNLWVRQAGFLSIERWQGRGSIPGTAQQRYDSSLESEPAPYSETRSVQIRNPSKAEHRIGLYYTRLGHEISTQEIPRVTLWLVWETGNFLAHICSSSLPQQSLEVSRTYPYYPELHPRKLSRSNNHGTCPENLERRTPRDKESIFPPRQRRLLP